MDVDTIDTTDPIERGELKAYVNTLCEQIDIMEDMIQWLITNEAQVRFGLRNVYVKVRGHTKYGETLYDVVEEFRRDPR